ncbi:MAG TPA: PIG-L family deacetylase [Terracidiphilus sp.]|nr:PIG-L family deacetylase [Terracidiphilus sp.]
MKLLAVLLLLAGTVRASAQIQPPLPGPDQRFKADVLVIVAHPDDDTAVSTFLAKAVFDQGKRAAVIFTTRGDAGPDAVGMTQSKALADVREMEARRSLARRGITNVWFLDGGDTPTQDVLHSLETVGHGQALEQIVRLIRLTRPEVILTWLPAYVAGENHGDHQAAGVMAVEAFDLAGNPTAFPEQVTAPRWYRGIANYGEGLQPWQPQKLYFVSDASHPDFLKGHGPAFLPSEISRTKHVPFAEINREAWKDYATQMDFDQKTLDYFVNMPEYLVLGKSLVPSGMEDDVWAGVSQKPIAYAPQAPYREPARTGISPALGGAWAFYREFYRAHGLEFLRGLVKPQTALSSDHQLWVPLLLRNNSGSPAEITLHQDLPAGWSGNTEDRTYRLDSGSAYPIQLFFTAPDNPKAQSPQVLSWTAMHDGTNAGKVDLDVYLEFDGVPQ